MEFLLFVLVIATAKAETLEAALDSAECYDPTGKACTCTGQSISRTRRGLTGTIPSALSACTGLSELCVQSCRASRMRVRSVEVYADLSLLLCVHRFDSSVRRRLDYNSLSGTIPTGLSALTGLTQLCVESCGAGTSRPPRYGSTVRCRPLSSRRTPPARATAHARSFLSSPLCPTV